MSTGPGSQRYRRDRSSTRDGVHDLDDAARHRFLRHRNRARRGKATPGHPRSTTVWPCADYTTCPTSATALGHLAPWLLTATVKTVTTYTRPGHRVLLVGVVDVVDSIAPAHLGAPRPVQPSPLSGLAEAAWTILRLGRGVRTELVGPTRFDQSGSNQTAVRVPAASAVSSGWTDESRSRPGLIPDSSSVSGRTAQHEPSDRVDRTDANARSERTGSGRVGQSDEAADRYDLIVMAVPPTASGWLSPADWASVLTPDGTLAVITHGHRAAVGVARPAGVLVAAAARGELDLLDRIVLLTTPARTDRPSSDSNRVRPSAAPAGECMPECSGELGPVASNELRATAEHADLLVFIRRPTQKKAAVGRVSGTESSDD